MKALDADPPMTISGICVGTETLFENEEVFVNKEEADSEASKEMEESPNETGAESDVTSNTFSRARKYLKIVLWFSVGR